MALDSHADTGASPIFSASAVSLRALLGASDDSVDASSRDEANERLARLVRAFFAAFPPDKDITFERVDAAVAPGRVNLIGEHIDYEGYSVLPMAISHTMGVAISSAPTMVDGLTLRITNTEPTYASVELTLSRSPTATANTDALFLELRRQLDTSTLWTQYVLCGLMAVVDWNGSLVSQQLDLLVVVDGTVPPACGLSSSSALVVASALALASHLCQRATPPLLVPTRTELAERCRYAEQHVGTAGGGMDQAVSCLAARDAALLVSFEPTLASESVAFPVEFQRRDVGFLVVHSGVEAHKAQDATARFNKRVVECALATKLLGKRLGLVGWEQMTRLSELHRALDAACGVQKQTFRQLLDKTRVLHDCDEFSREQLARELSPAACLSSLFAGSRLEKAATLVFGQESRFRLWQRARHVWSEAERVLEFRRLLAATAATTTTREERLDALGKLMVESHKSCQDLYECSCAELDAIVALAMAHGAYGARLTGAGWGGCVVVLVPVDRVEAIRSALVVEFFKSSSSSPPPGLMFESTAAQGAQLFAVLD